MANEFSAGTMWRSKEPNRNGHYVFLTILESEGTASKRVLIDYEVPDRADQALKQSHEATYTNKRIRQDFLPLDEGQALEVNRLRGEMIALRKIVKEKAEIWAKEQTPDRLAEVVKFEKSLQEFRILLIKAIPSLK